MKASELPFKMTPDDGLVVKTSLPLFDAEIELAIWPENETTKEPSQRQLEATQVLLDLDRDFLPLFHETAWHHLEHASPYPDEGIPEITKDTIGNHYRIFGAAVPDHTPVKPGRTCFFLQAGIDWYRHMTVQCLVINGTSVVFENCNVPWINGPLWVRDFTDHL